MKNILFSFIISFSVFNLESSNINWSFPPVALSSTGVDASGHDVAMDANGNAVAVWIESGVVKSRYQHVNMGWSSSPTTLSHTVATACKVVLDPNGNATAVWLENGVVKAASKSLSGNWTSATTLSESGAASPHLAVDQAGDVIAVWVENGNVQTSTKPFGGNWQNHVTITNPGSMAVSPYIAMATSGSNKRAFIVWSSVTDAVSTIYASTKNISGSWSYAIPISAPSQQAANARVAVDSNGNATAVWYAYDLTGSVYSSVVVQGATRPVNTGLWSDPVSLSDPGFSNPTNFAARVAYDSLGNAIVLWSLSFDGETYTIQSATNPVYGTWSQPTTLLKGNLYALEAALSVNALSDAITAYMFYNGTSIGIQAAEQDITGYSSSSWSVPLNISTGSQNGYPSLASALTGNTLNTVAVWLTYNGTDEVLVASTGSKSVVTPPSGLLVTQNENDFGVFNSYSNTLSWTASTSPNAAGYLIFRNGVFLEQVGANVQQIVDYNQPENGTVTYSVATIDSQQDHSPIVSVTFN